MFFHKQFLNVAIKSHKSKQTMEKMDVFLNDYHTSTIKQTYPILITKIYKMVIYNSLLILHPYHSRHIGITSSVLLHCSMSVSHFTLWSLSVHALWFFFLPPKTFKLFGVPFFLIMYLMKVIPETYHVQLIRYLCFS
jgi:hypothetical protein